MDLMVVNGHDLGSVLGIGYPAWTGGALSYIETVGLPRFVAECRRMARQYGPRFKPTRALVRMAREGLGFYPLTAAGPTPRPGSPG